MERIARVNTDPNLLAQQAAHDPQSFASLYDCYFSRVFNYLRYRCEDDNTADELAAQTFERLLNKLERYDPRRGPFEPWLFAIARNLVTDHHRKSWQRWLPWDNLQRLPAAEPGPEVQLIQQENQVELWAAVDRLDSRSRDLLGLKFGARLNNRQIADRSGLSESNVGVLLYRSIMKLRAQLAPLHKD